MSSVQSVERAFGVLRCLAGGPAGVSEIADRLGLPKSTVSRLLSTLHAIGAVDQVDAGGEYRIGPVITELAAGASPGADLIAVARPHLAGLVELIGETAGIAVLEGADAHYLAHVEADNLVQMRDWTGERIPAHVVPSGLVMLAYLPEVDSEELLTPPLERFTARSVTDPARLRKRLAAIRHAGYAWVIEEYSEELNSVAAPVRDATGQVIAAIHVHGPSYRFPPAGGSDEVTAAVVSAAARLSDRLANLTVTAHPNAVRSGRAR